MGVLFGLDLLRNVWVEGGDGTEDGAADIDGGDSAAICGAERTREERVSTRRRVAWGPENVPGDGEVGMRV